MSKQQHTKASSKEVAEKKTPKMSRTHQRCADVAAVLKMFTTQKADIKVTETKDGMVVTPQKSLDTREFARVMLGNRPVRTKMVQDVGITNSGAGAALASSIPADMTLALGYSNWFNLFDEVKCHEVTAKVVMALGSATTNDTATLVWAANWDPMQAAAPGSIASVLSAARNLGPIPTHSFTGSSIPTPNICQGLVPVSTKGHYALSSGRLQSLFPPSSGGVVAPSPIGGDWVSTSSGALVTGYFKYYAEALGGTSVWTFRSFHVYDVEFRFRG